MYCWFVKWQKSSTLEKIKAVKTKQTAFKLHYSPKAQMNHWSMWLNSIGEQLTFPLQWFQN